MGERKDPPPPYPCVSASQVTLFRDQCARKWGFKYLEGFKEPQSPAQKLGDEVETLQLQPYLLEGRPPDDTKAGQVARTALDLLPAPKTPGLAMQKRFIVPSPTWANGVHVGFGFQGYEDFALPDSGAMPEMPGGAPLVGDFKTTVDFRWAKTEETLATDVQAQLYAFATMYETRAKVVDLAWVYMRTRAPFKAKRVHLRVTADHAAEQFAKINDTALEMAKARLAKPNPLELPPNPDHCDAFGGCPHRHRCFPNLSPPVILDAYDARTRTKEEDAMTAGNVLAQLQARRAKAQGAGAAPGATAATPTPAAQVPIVDASTSTIIGKAPDGTNIYSHEEWRLGQPGAVDLRKKPDTFGDPTKVHAPTSIPSQFLTSTPYAGATGVNSPESTLPPAPSTAPTPPPVEATEAPKRRGRAPRAAPGTPAAAPPAPPAPGAIDYAALASAVVDEIVARLAGAA